MKNNNSHIAPIGKPDRVLKKITLNHPPDFKLLGYCIVCTLEIIEHKPKDANWVPKVAMNGGNFSFPMSIPLVKPKIKPEKMTNSNDAPIGQPQTLNATPPISAEPTVTDPIDRSIPPVMITKVIPIARNPM